MNEEIEKANTLFKMVLADKMSNDKNAAMSTTVSDYKSKYIDNNDFVPLMKKSIEGGFYKGPIEYFSMCVYALQTVGIYYKPLRGFKRNDLELYL